MNEHKFKKFKGKQIGRVTQELKLINNGADDKYSVVIHFFNAQGGTDAYVVADELRRGDEIVVSLATLSTVIKEFYVSWEDACARIRRYSQHQVTKGSQGFKKIDCWWVTFNGKQEEQFLGGMS